MCTGTLCSAVCVSAVVYSQCYTPYFSALCGGAYVTAVCAIAIYKGHCTAQFVSAINLGHYFTTRFVIAVCSGSLLYCILCHSLKYRGIIILLSLSLRYIQSHCIVVLVIAGI